LLLSLLVFYKGAEPEFGIATGLLAMIILDIIYHAVFGVALNLAEADIGHVIIDTLVAIAFVAIAITANRIYPLWIAALQLVALSAHLVREVANQISPIAYAILYILPSYFQIVALSLGLYLHIRRRKKLGNYRAWRRF